MKPSQLVFDVYTESYNSEEPELLFISDNDVEMDTSTEFLPMPLKNKNEQYSDTQRHIRIEPEIQLGTYLLKFKVKLTTGTVPYKVLLSVNGVKNIDNNGLYRGMAPQNSQVKDKYSMFLPGPGEFRILPDVCGNIQLQHPTFKDLTG